MRRQCPIELQYLSTFSALCTEKEFWVFYMLFHTVNITNPVNFIQDHPKCKQSFIIIQKVLITDGLDKSG